MSYRHAVEVGTTTTEDALTERVAAALGLRPGTDGRPATDS